MRRGKIVAAPRERVEYNDDGVMDELASASAGAFLFELKC